MTSDKLMMALLALDAYSRTSDDPDLKDDVRVFGLIGDSSIGTATITDVWNDAESSFVAVEYAWNGKVVISFRGTDNPLKDSLSGWTLGAGWNDGSQVQMATSFYESVTGHSIFEEAPGNVVLTGHSLGGGLAGYVSAVSGAKGFGFDHMPFLEAAEKTYISHLNMTGADDPTGQQFASSGLRFPDSGNFVGTFVEGEVMEDYRNGYYAELASSLANGLTPVLGQLGMQWAWLAQELGEVSRRV
jgi:Protein of unknown function (DUF2974).